jgi:hypothetical protein
MAIVSIMESIMVLVQGLLSHFVSGATSTIEMTADFEWALNPGTPELTTKGKYLSGALADIVVYGAILVDWIVQSLLGTGVQANNVI